MTSSGTIRTLGALSAAALLTACGSSQPPKRAVTAADFASPEPLREPAGAPEPSRPIERLSDDEVASARALLETVELEPGSPDLDEPAVSTGGPVLVDAKVGDVNGRPIQASSFFEPIEDRLIANAERMSPAQWRAEAREIIKQQLNLTIENELLKSEALEILPEPVVKQGLRNFVESIREGKIREAGGSSTRADQRAISNTGQTVDETAQAELDKQLIDLAYIREIQGRVHVSRHDLELFYERNYGRFNPTPAAIFRRIRVPKRDEEAVSRITRELEGGADFAVVATDKANFDKEILRKEFPSPEAGFEEIVVYGGEELEPVNEALRTLQPGAWTGPFDMGSSLVWFQLVEIDEPDRMSFYEAQDIIERILRDRLVGLERQRYITELKKRASYTDLDELTRRLMAIAETRYLKAD